MDKLERTFFTVTPWKAWAEGITCMTECRTVATSIHTLVARYLPRAPWTELPTNTHWSMQLNNNLAPTHPVHKVALDSNYNRQSKSNLADVGQDMKHKTCQEEGATKDIVHYLAKKVKWPLAFNR